jgi:hypothetical protein
MCLFPSCVRCYDNIEASPRTPRLPPSREKVVACALALFFGSLASLAALGIGAAGLLHVHVNVPLPSWLAQVVTPIGNMCPPLLSAYGS